MKLFMSYLIAISSIELGQYWPKEKNIKFGSHVMITKLG